MLYDEGRVPVIALDYSERHMALAKELMIDYDNGKMYVVSKDGTKIVDISSAIANALKNNIVINDIKVDIDGLGETNLKDLLEEVLSEEATFVVQEEILFAPNTNIDNASLKIKDAKMQIDNFDTAEEFMIPQKRDGRIKWVTKPTTDVVGIEVANNKLTLDGNYVYRLNNSNISATVIMKDIDTDYALTKLVINVGTNVPSLMYGENIKWINGNGPTMTINSTMILEFETFDKGAKWLGKYSKYI